MRKRATLFVPITKVDLEHRLVYGVAAEERTDKTGAEKFDYATSKPLFEAWSRDFLKRTTEAGLEPSHGNVRLMHQPVVAGKVAEPLAFDDAAKTISLVAYVGSDDALGMVARGELTGFSIGGSYENRWKDEDETGVWRYTAKPAEISLVDNPCMYGATIQMVKADGCGTMTLTGGATAKVVADLTARVEAVQQRLVGAKRGAELVKGLYDVGRLADVLCSLRYILESLTWERDNADTGSTVPEELADAIADVAEVLLRVAEESTRPLRDGATEPLALVAAATLGKAGARNSKSDATRLQTIHDYAVENGATCAAEKAAPVAPPATPPQAANAATEEIDMTLDELQKALGANNDALLKAVQGHVDQAIGTAVAPLTKTIEAQGATLTALQETVAAQAEQIKVIGEAPAATPAVKTIVADPGGTGAAPVDPEKATPEELVKLAMRSPITVARNAA